MSDEPSCSNDLDPQLPRCAWLLACSVSRQDASPQSSASARRIPGRILSGNGVHRFRNHCSTSPEYAGWLFDYVTDFSYQGLGQDAELCKELDFNFLDGEHTMLGWGPLRLAEARELFDIWQSNFIAYCRLECFTVSVTGD